MMMLRMPQRFILLFPLAHARVQFEVLIRGGPMKQYLCLHVHSATASVQELRPSALRSELAYRALRVLDSSPVAGSGSLSKNFFSWQRGMPQLVSSAPSRPLGCVPIDWAKRRNAMQTQQTITFFGTVSNSAASPRTAASTPPSESPSYPTATFRPFIITSLPSASRATSPTSFKQAPASS
jgi:hypothetical protein